MKVTPISLPELYANWMASNWSMLLGRMPAYQAKEPTPELALRSPARRAAPAKKRSTGRKAKGAKRR